MPSVESIDVASPSYWSGAVKRSPCYALLLNAEPPTSYIDNSRLSAGYLSVLPARMSFTFRGLPTCPAEVKVKSHATYKVPCRDYLLQPFVLGFFYCTTFLLFDFRTLRNGPLKGTLIELTNDKTKLQYPHKTTLDRVSKNP